MHPFLADIAAHPRAGVYAEIASFASAYFTWEAFEHEAQLKSEMPS